MKASCHRVLDLLRERPRTTGEWAELYLPRAAARVHELRALGYEIEVRRIRANSCLFTLISEPDAEVGDPAHPDIARDLHSGPRVVAPWRLANATNGLICALAATLALAAPLPAVANGAATANGGASPTYCRDYPVLATAKGAVKRAKKGWNARKVDKNGEAIRRVRIQSHCAPSRRGRRHVERAIDHARADYRKARQEQATENAYGDIDPPGAAYLAGLRACESGGDYTAVSASGTYRGAYQFDVGTWASVGGSGDPAAASPDEQDFRAALLWRSRGSSPWPVCG